MLCQAWANHPHVRRLDIIVNQRAPNDFFALPASTAHVHIHQLDAHPFGINEWWQMHQLMRMLQPDWIYAPYVVMPPRHAPTKRLLTVHDAIPLELHSMSAIRQMILTQIVRFSMTHADSITTVSSYAAHQIRRHYAYHGHIEVIPNGVSELFFAVPDTHYLAKYGITQPFGLCVSSNQPHKNLSGLVQAWAAAYRAGKIPQHSQLVLAGHVDTRRPMPWHNPAYADIPLIHVPDPDDGLLTQLYHAAHLFVLPSLAEGFGLPVLEALAAERVVLCHDYPTLRDLHGDVVAYTDMRQPSQIADALHRLWHDHDIRQQLMGQAKAHAQAFRWATVADRYIAYMQTR
jgi:glycosyltransferase involved in cell wall biosynthesis